MSQNIKLDDFLKEQLQDEKLAAMYLEECLAAGDSELYKKALSDVAKIKNIDTFTSCIRIERVKTCKSQKS